jgi:hypothetical protein
MPLATINGRDGTADFTIAGASYAAILNEFECESNVELIDSSVFSIEGVATQDPGMERIFFRLNGLLKKGSAVAGPLIPAPQNVQLVFTYSALCTISFVANFSRALARRTVNRNAVMAGEGVSNGAFAVIWAHA